MIGLFEEGLQKFRSDADKELVLQLVVRYLKYLIAVKAEKEKIQEEFKVGMGGGGEGVHGGAGAELAGVRAVPVVLQRPGREGDARGGRLVGAREGREA